MEKQIDNEYVLSVSNFIAQNQYLFRMLIFFASCCLLDEIKQSHIEDIANSCSRILCKKNKDKKFLNDIYKLFLRNYNNFNKEEFIECLKKFISVKAKASLQLQTKLVKLLYKDLQQLKKNSYDRKYFEKLLNYMNTSSLNNKFAVVRYVETDIDAISEESSKENNYSTWNEIYKYAIEQDSKLKKMANDLETDVENGLKKSTRLLNLFLIILMLTPIYFVAFYEEMLDSFLTAASKIFGSGLNLFIFTIVLEVIVVWKISFYIGYNNRLNKYNSLAEQFVIELNNENTELDKILAQMFDIKISFSENIDNKIEPNLTVFLKPNFSIYNVNTDNISISEKKSIFPKVKSEHTVTIKTSYPQSKTESTLKENPKVSNIQEEICINTPTKIIRRLSNNNHNTCTLSLDKKQVEGQVLKKGHDFKLISKWFKVANFGTTGPGTIRPLNSKQYELKLGYPLDNYRVYGEKQEFSDENCIDFTTYGRALHKK